MPDPASRWLQRLRTPDGGWGPYPGAPPRTEATALAAFALSASEGRDAAASGLEWLLSRQRPGGAWPLGDGGPDSPHWSTSLAVLALSKERPEAARRGAGWLLEQKGRGEPWWAPLMRRLAGWRSAVELDPGLTGWPWAAGTFSWVEPTSYAILALKSLGAGVSDSPMGRRIEEAERMLIDRACRGGGWNYGNSVVLGEELWPYPDTTGVSLLALADRPGLPVVDESLDILEPMALDHDSILALSLGALALRAHGRPAGTVLARLASRVEGERGGPIEARALAWAALALSGAGPFPFGAPRPDG